MEPHTQLRPAGSYDLSMLEELDDNEYMLEVLTIWLMESPKDISDMKTALLENRIDIVCKKAHKLKSSAGVIQAENLRILLQELEVKGKSGVTVEELEFMLARVTKEYDLIEGSLKNYLEELSRKTA